MSQPFIGEVRLVPYNFAPVGWAFCQGQLTSISENSALFNLIGTTYGGDGQQTFGYPDLRGRVTVHPGNGFVLAQTGGTETVTLTTNQLPKHTHSFMASSNANGNVSTPGNNTVGASIKMFSTVVPATPMNASMVGNSTGGNQPHDNMQPYLTLNWIISLFGVYPSPS